MKTLRLKLRPGNERWLNDASVEVNFCWNYFNEVSHKAIKPFFGPPRFLTGFDLINLASGASKEFDLIDSRTIGCIARELEPPPTAHPLPRQGRRMKEVRDAL